jgi:hypothetical protein
MTKLKEAINKTVEQMLTGTHNELFNDTDLSIVCDMTLELLRNEIKGNPGLPFEDCVISFKFNGKDYDADYWQELTEEGDEIWCCEVTEFDIEMNMRDYNTEFLWSDYADNI